MGDGIFLLIPILFPIVAGLVVFAVNHRIARQIYVGTVLVPVSYTHLAELGDCLCV